MPQPGPLSWLRLNNSPRVPSFAGPCALAAALLCVCLFSEPFWQNFYLVKADSLNVTMKAGAWGVCNRLRNNTNVVGPSTWCTSKMSGYNFNFILNSTGINQFPTEAGDSIILGTTGTDGISILTASTTGLVWVHVIAAILSVLTVVSLILPPSYLGSPESRLFAFQKSGLAPVLLAIVSSVLAFIAFILYLVIILPAKNRLNDIDGISASVGNALWFVLPSSLLYLPALFSVLMRSSRNEYADL
ncbi:SUR7/PalI family-domain-containing protein [Leucosporidium creatinivorum]|uniref:SUR7/PalI family-domain-containing protein n=1 Tax=Leucosporidium creatinivorum TaxID=106004 RepID=A0A1Y2FY36_9BASI|nr:SUR7/PalI family-domain-containing protein [Leucosporidium creatinivorum]